MPILVATEIMIMTLIEAKQIESEANGRWMIVKVGKTEYMFYPDMIDQYTDVERNDAYIYGSMINPHHRCTNTCRWFYVSNATFLRYQDK